MDEQFFRAMLLTILALMPITWIMCRFFDNRSDEDRIDEILDAIEESDRLNEEWMAKLYEELSEQTEINREILEEMKYWSENGMTIEFATDSDAFMPKQYPAEIENVPPTPKRGPGRPRRIREIGE